VIATEDLQLANAWQRGFPLVPRPFAEIGARCGLSEAQVIEGYRELQARGIVDRIGPVFRPNTVGASTLAAMAVPPDRLAEVGALVSSQPGVNHNYERDHPFNLWFVATGSTEADVARAICAIEEAAGIKVLRLPLLEEFHIDLGFDLEDRSVPRTAPAKAEALALSAGERVFLSRVSSGLPLAPRPYGALGVAEDEAIAMLRRWLERGAIRRIGAVVRHRAIGYRANAMVAWDVPEERVAPLGRRLATDPLVTLCYHRARALPDWPYNLYCMVHGRERAGVTYEIKRLSVAHGLGRFPRTVLFSNRCFSQRAARYG
jgi:DNA-binding Lrp family transcriptional regulator